MSFPWLPIGGKPLVVSDEFRLRIEKRGFDGVRFRSAIKSHIVNLNWHEWDRSAWPKVLPRNEPESYIRSKKHNMRVASQMCDAWELLPPIMPIRMEHIEDPSDAFLDRYQATSDQKVFASLFADRPDNYACLVVDESGREWLSREVGEWVKFCKVEFVSA